MENYINKPWPPVYITQLFFFLSYSTVVLYIGIMKVWGFWPEIITPKSA